MENSTTSQHTLGGKGLILAGFVVLILIIFGVVAALNSGKASKYQGMIQKIETETDQLQKLQDQI